VFRHDNSNQKTPDPFSSTLGRFFEVSSNRTASRLNSALNCLRFVIEHLLRGLCPLSRYLSNPGYLRLQVSVMPDSCWGVVGFLQRNELRRLPQHTLYNSSNRYLSQDETGVLREAPQPGSRSAMVKSVGSNSTMRFMLTTRASFGSEVVPQVNAQE
jgi:hypothetical protein